MQMSRLLVHVPTKSFSLLFFITLIPVHVSSKPVLCPANRCICGPLAEEAERKWKSEIKRHTCSMTSGGRLVHSALRNLIFDESFFADGSGLGDRSPTQSKLRAWSTRCFIAWELVVINLFSV